MKVNKWKQNKYEMIIENVKGNGNNTRDKC